MTSVCATLRHRSAVRLALLVDFPPGIMILVERVAADSLLGTRAQRSTLFGSHGQEALNSGAHAVGAALDDQAVHAVHAELLDTVEWRHNDRCSGGGGLQDHQRKHLV